MLINVKMPTNVGILTFMSRVNFVLSSFVTFISFFTDLSDHCQISLMLKVAITLLKHTEINMAPLPVKYKLLR